MCCTIVRFGCAVTIVLIAAIACWAQQANSPSPGEIPSAGQGNQQDVPIVRPDQVPVSSTPKRLAQQDEQTFRGRPMPGDRYVDAPVPVPSTSHTLSDRLGTNSAAPANGVENPTAVQQASYVRGEPQQDVPVPDILSRKRAAPAAAQGAPPAQQDPMAERAFVARPPSGIEADSKVAQTAGQEVVPTRVAQAPWQSPSSLREPTTGPQAANRLTPARVVSATTIQSAGPALRVEAIGADTVAVGKATKYEIIVANEGTIDARNVIVGIDVPTWIEITGVTVSNGNRESTDGSQEARLIWTVDAVAAGQTQRMSIDMVPHEAKMFDLNLQWTIMPISRSAQVRVTEPRLEIKIVGPDEVHFGEKVIYNVTVSNPGTGAADNVSVMLPEALGGERAALGQIEPGDTKEFQVELVARNAGTLDLTASVVGDGNLSASDTRNLIVRRANLAVDLTGPRMKFAGGTATYELTVSNAGDAMARDVVAAVSLPQGIDYLSGIEAVEKINGGLRWSIGTLSPGSQRTFHLSCQLSRPGEMNIEAAARGTGELAASGNITTTVEAVADLVLEVEDPKGPLPVGQDVTYQIRIRNRGTKNAREVNLLMQFSEGIEPTSAQGHRHEIVPGQVLFSPIAQLDAGQEMVLKVIATAGAVGTHIFRAQLTCDESDTREVTEGTTKFFGDRNDVVPERDASRWEDGRPPESAVDR